MLKVFALALGQLTSDLPSVVLKGLALARGRLGNSINEPTAAALVDGLDKKTEHALSSTRQSRAEGEMLSGCVNFAEILTKSPGEDFDQRVSSTS